MSTETKKKRRGRPPIDPKTAPGERSNVLLQGRVSRPIYAAFLEYIADYNSNHVRADKSAFVEEAVRDYLVAKGWPIAGGSV